MTTNNLRINFDVLADIAQRGTRRAMAFVALGQKIWSDASVESVKLDVPFGFALLPDPMPKDLASEVRSTFRQWISGNALAEIVQGLSLFADEYFKIAVLHRP